MRFKTNITAQSDDGQIVTLSIHRGCPHIVEIADEIAKEEELDAYSICIKPCSGIVFEAAGKYCRHAACPVPVGIIKCIEAECSLALPKNAAIEFID